MNYDAAYRRIDRLMLALGTAGTAFFGLEKGWRAALVFAFGALVSAMNFRWLKGGVDALAAKFTSQPTSQSTSQSTPQPPRWVALKFIARYALLGAAGYGIFTGLRVSLPVFLAGLFVSIAAIMAEMIYQLAMGTRNAS